MKSYSVVYLLLLMVSVVSKALGVVRETLQAAFFGSTAQTDAYAVSITLPVLLVAFVGASLATNFIPLLQRIRTERGEAAGNLFANNILHITIISVSGVMAVGSLCAAPLIRFLSPGFDIQTMELAVQMTYIAMPTALFSVLNIFLLGIYNSRKEFLLPTMLGLVLNVSLIGALFLAYWQGIVWLSSGVTVGLGLQFILQWRSIARTGYRWQWVCNWRDPDFLFMLRLCVPTAVAGSVNQINLLVDRALASELGSGAISALQYGSRLTAIVYEMLLFSLITMLFPEMARLAAEKDSRALSRLVRQGVRGIWLLSLPIALILAIQAEAITRVVFMRGQFDEQAVALTAASLSCFAIGLPAIGLVEFSNRAFYSQHNTKTPLLAGMVGVGLNVLLSVMLVQIWQQRGLAFANSAAAIAQAVLLLWLLQKREVPVWNFELCSALFKITVAAVAPLPLFWVWPFSWWINSFIYCIAYLCLIYLLRCEETVYLTSQLQRLRQKIRSRWGELR